MALCLGGCADYLERRDTVTFAAGEAQSWNRVIHTIDPWPPYVTNTRITSNGERVARATRSYFDGGGGSAGAATATLGQDQPAAADGANRD